MISHRIRNTLIVAGTLAVLSTTACTAHGSVSLSPQQAPQDGTTEVTSSGGAADSPSSGSDSSSSDSGSSSTGSSAAGSATPGSSSEGGAPSSGGQECRTEDLKVALGESDGAAGHIYAPIQFTNTSSRTCTLTSAPGVSFVGGDDGHQIGQPAKRQITDRPVVTLAPGRTASAPFEFSTIAHMNPEDCAAQPARGLRIYPPHSTESVFVPLGSGTECTTYADESAFDHVGVVRAGGGNTEIN